MGVVTWKNIAPSNPAGILSAANQAAKAMGEGFSGVGTALQEGVDKKVQSETDQFVSDLMGLETQEQRDAMISEANDAWLNLETINQTNYELGAPARAKLAMEEAASTKHYFDMLRVAEEAKNAEALQLIKNSGITSNSKNYVGADLTAVSYTHLTLPTIYSV